MLPHNSTNLRNRVNKLYLPKTKAKSLYPLFEVISNSIHAIHEGRKESDRELTGKVLIRLIRNGDPKVLKAVRDIEQYPINSFKITDNGVGLNDDNMKSFSEFDSEKKAKIGGKGVGRLICLKAFQKLIIHSVYKEDGEFRLRKFNYKKSKEGFDEYEDNIPTSKTATGTSVTLSMFEPDYGNHVPREMVEIGRQIVTHFQLYFNQNIEPEIILINQDDIELNLTTLFNKEFQREILDREFEVSNQAFKVFISKSFMAKSHKIYYCAHERIAKDEGLSKYLEDFRSKIENENEEGFYFQVFVVGEYLNKHVNEARTGFDFSLEDDQESADLNEVTLSKIRKGALHCIEELLSEFLEKVRQEKLDKYFPIIEREYPNYTAVVNNNMEKVRMLPAGLSNHELDLKLYEIESEWRIEVKTEGVDLIEKKKDITELDEYKELYANFLAEFNTIGQMDLARYVIHRRSVIDLLDHLISLGDDEKFANEDIVHNLFFPIQETGKSVSHDKQNLWLLDERLTFNSLLASDKLFKQIDELDSTSGKRVDVLIRQEEVFQNAALFAEAKYPFESFTIVEFKKPERNDYVEGNIKLDPVKQVRMYIEDILKGNSKVGGKRIEADKKSPFYCYIVADKTPSLEKILDYHSFEPTPDGLGRFRFFETKTSRAYVEVLPFKKVIKDAKQRNKILFDKLKLS